MVLHVLQGLNHVTFRWAPKDPPLLLIKPTITRPSIPRPSALCTWLWHCGIQLATGYYSQPIPDLQIVWASNLISQLQAASADWHFLLILLSGFLTLSGFFIILCCGYSKFNYFSLAIWAICNVKPAHKTGMKHPIIPITIHIGQTWFTALCRSMMIKKSWWLNVIPPILHSIPFPYQVDRSG